MLNGKSILITGGTGSLGKALTKTILEKYPSIKRLVIFSRDEQKQYQMSSEFTHPSIRYFIGDVRDVERLKTALQGIDYVIHTAAMKHVHIAEYNPDECIKTNIGGAQNVIKATLETSVQRVVSLSTDKACAPINLYGATKLTSDKLFIAANNIKGNRDIRFSVVRYGNVMGSNGSVVPFFLKKKSEGIPLPVTNLDMTRFNISLEQGVGMVLYALENAWGGELYVPKIPSFKILDLVKVIDNPYGSILVGMRPGEKLHEEMITPSDSYNTYDLGHYYVILPQDPMWNIDQFIEDFHAIKVRIGFSYNSKDNRQYETVESLKQQIAQLNDNSVR